MPGLMDPVRIDERGAASAEPQPLPEPQPRPRQVASDGKTNILIVGSGAREHALLWHLGRSSMAGEIYVAPGNGGTHDHNIGIDAADTVRLYEFARHNDCVTVVGPELPLALGVVDLFRSEGMPIFGPTQRQAKIEWSKSYSKALMRELAIPTAAFSVFTEPEPAIAYASGRGWNVAVKADGLADGKGVRVCSSEAEVRAAVADIMDRKVFGGAGNSIIVEDRIYGTELSVFALCDGIRAVYLGSAVDHKQLLDGGKGPNTGGMGAYSPAELSSDTMVRYVMSRIMDPVVARTEFSGFLYAGLMLTHDGPKVIEFNSRLGDPEAQVILPRLDFDLLPYLNLVSTGGRLGAGVRLNLAYEAACCVSMCSEGYPLSHKDNQGRRISGVDEANARTNTLVFHAGTRLEDGKPLTDGGRVLSVVGRGRSLDHAVREAYRSVDMISFKGEQHRTDIGRTRLRA